MRKKMVFIKVTTESIYAFEEGAINGWDADEVIEEWFKKFPIDTRHASRDAHQIGNTPIVTKAVVMNEEQEEKQQVKIKKYYKKIDKRLKDIKKRQEDFVNKWTDGSWAKIDEWR